MKHKWIIISGLVVGAFSVALTIWGNPANMGFCIACFLRDIAGGLGLHRAASVQYLRPEIVGLGLGSMLIALATGEFKVRGGANPLRRFVLGFLGMIGALAFLGCPLRMILRLAGGDLTALIGLFGFIGGIQVGVAALKSGYYPGRAVPQAKSTGFVYPVILISLLAALLLRPDFIIFSESGPGSMAAPAIAALAAGLLTGAFVQRSRLCMAGGIRDAILIKDPHLLWGFVAIFVAALAGNLILGSFHLGFAGQPVAHTQHLWNFLGMTVVGIAAVLAGGCPMRQLILAGEGDTDAVLTVLGMVVGAAFAHNFGLAASPAGLSADGRVAVIVALAILVLIGFGHRLGSKCCK